MSEKKPNKTILSDVLLLLVGIVVLLVGLVLIYIGIAQIIKWFDPYPEYDELALVSGKIEQVVVHREVKFKRRGHNQWARLDINTGTEVIRFVAHSNLSMFETLEKDQRVDLRVEYKSRFEQSFLGEPEKILYELKSGNKTILSYEQVSSEQAHWWFLITAPLVIIIGLIFLVVGCFFCVPMATRFGWMEETEGFH